LLKITGQLDAQIRTCIHPAIASPFGRSTKAARDVAGELAKFRALAQFFARCPIQRSSMALQSKSMFRFHSSRHSTCSRLALLFLRRRSPMNRREVSDPAANSTTLPGARISETCNVDSFKTTTSRVRFDLRTQTTAKGFPSCA